MVDHRNFRNTLVLSASFQDNLDKPVPVCQNVLDLAAARDDGGGGGDSRNSLRSGNLWSNPTTNTQFFFLPAGCLSCRPSDSVN